MASAMAIEAKSRYDTWISIFRAEDSGEAYADLYRDWLREGDGVPAVGEKYSLAVETFLLILLEYADRHRPLVDHGDDNAWDFMTELGFKYEVYQYRHRQTVRAGPGR
jgi:hypothetical protein